MKHSNLESKVPKQASQTFTGQSVIKNVVEPIPYRGHLKPIKEETIRAFGLGEREAEVALGRCKHKYNFIDQNKLVAARYRDQ